MIYPSNNPPVCLIGYQPCSFYGINYAMLKSLVSIQNGRVCYQGCPPNMGSDVDIERLNEAIKIVISRTLSIWHGRRLGRQSTIIEDVTGILIMGLRNVLSQPGKRY